MAVCALSPPLSPLVPFSTVLQDYYSLVVLHLVVLALVPVTLVVVVVLVVVLVLVLLALVSSSRCTNKLPACFVSLVRCLFHRQVGVPRGRIGCIASAKAIVASVRSNWGALLGVLSRPSRQRS